MGSVNGAENCPLCDTPLTISVADVTLHFTQHTTENCRLMTLDRIRMLTSLVQSSSVETAEQQRMKCEYGKYADRLKGLLRENDIAIPHERWYAEDMERAVAAQKYYASLSYEGEF